MADRTAAGIFGKIFELLAKNPTEEHKAIAKEIFAETVYYDFGSYLMDAEEALIALDLAKKGIDPKYPEVGESIIYGKG
jgi:hypothetical protein